MPSEFNRPPLFHPKQAAELLEIIPKGDNGADRIITET
jgi:hypothetical protein